METELSTKRFKSESELRGKKWADLLTEQTGKPLQHLPYTSQVLVTVELQSMSGHVISERGTGCSRGEVC